MTFFKKTICTIILVTSVTGLFLIFKPAFAQFSMTDLILLQIREKTYEIRDITYSILEKINETPVYLDTIVRMAESWINTEDTSEHMGNAQNVFTTLAEIYNDGLGKQNDMTYDLTKHFLESGKTSEEGGLPDNANAVSYTTFTNRPLVEIHAPISSMEDTIKDSLKASYISNAAAANYRLKQPDSSWRPTEASGLYNSYYNTLAAIQSYNNYVISNLMQQPQYDEAARWLTDNASSGDWFGEVASEPLGQVLRQLLMYTSQVYVQLNRIVMLQRQQLAIAAMTNSMLIISTNQFTGDQLYARAQAAKS